MSLSKARYSSLMNIYIAIDQLIDKLKLKGSYDAYEWIRTHKPHRFKGNPFEALFDKSFSKKVCNQEIISQFHICYEQTSQFLKQYLKEKHSLSTSSPTQIFKNCLSIGLATPEETENMLSMIENLYDLCHECNDSGDHLVTNELVDHYRTMYTIMSRINIP